MNACLGLSWLGTCPYDPALPSLSYFTLGDAIAALAFTMAVQAFLKPIYRLRLRVRHLSIGRLYGVIFAGVGMTIIAALLPSFPFLHGGWWGYPIVYEVLATLLFAVSYGAVAIAVAMPIKVREGRVEAFTQYTAGLLSEARESDHVDLLPDLMLSVPRLITLAAFIEHRRDASAFWRFTHRDRIVQAQYARTILGILSDTHFCRSVVLRAPWAVVRLVRNIADRQLYAQAAEKLVQQLSLQALLLDDGIMTREIAHHGFREAPLLSEALFSEAWIVLNYNPLENFLRGEEITASVLKRFNKATIRCYECLIEAKEFQRSQVTYSIERFYESAGLRAWSLHERDSVDVEFSIEFSRAVSNAIALANKLMAAADKSTYNHMFVTKAEEFRHDPLEPLVEIVFNAMGHISKGFTGPNDTFWHLAIKVMHDGYHSIGEEPDGMTPFQQRLTLKLVDTLKNNMDGWYPAVCRVLLATVGPYDHDALQPNMTAFNILRNAMYRELKRLPELAATTPEKISDYLPSTTYYDVERATLTQTYFGGKQRLTDLKAIKPIEIDLVNEKYRRVLTEDELSAAERAIY